MPQATRPASPLQPLDKLLRRLLDALAVGLLAAIAVICFTEVVLREVAAYSLGWYDEFVGYLLVWLTLVGVALAQQDGAHIAVVAFHRRLGARATRARRLLVHVLSLGVQLVLLYYGSLLAFRFLNDRAISLPISMGLLYAIVPSSAFLIMAVHAVQVVQLVREAD